jgi:hypothetical protein
MFVHAHIFSLSLSLTNSNLLSRMSLCINLQFWSKLWFACNGSVSGKVAMVDLSGPWMTLLVAVAAVGILYFYLKYMGARYNFFKENEFAPIGSLIGSNNPSEAVLLFLETLKKLIKSASKED